MPNTRTVLAALAGLLAMGSQQYSLAQRPPAETEDQMGRRVLAEVLARVQGTRPEVRAKIWLEAGKQLDQDKRKPEERKMLMDAYAATLEASEPTKGTMAWLQSEILRTMINNLGPEPVETLLPKLDEYNTGVAYDLLVTRYTADQNWDHAMQTLLAAPKTAWFPYAPANRLTEKLPPARAVDRRAIFQTVYNICQQNKRGYGALEPMLELSWRDFPREHVLEVIPHILHEAMYGDSHSIKMPTREYERIKPQLLPIWKQLDPTAAAAWERNEAETWAAERAKPYSWESSSQQAPTQAPSQTKPLSPLPPQPPKPVDPAAQRALKASINEEAARRKPRPVMGCMEDEPWCQSNRIEHALTALRDNLLKKDMVLAKAGVAKGFGYARSQWKLDTDPADPNQVIKTQWPSTTTWEMFAVMATRVSPDFAIQQIATIPDSEIQLLAKVILARLWLDSRPFFQCPSSHFKYHNDGGSCVGFGQYMPPELFDLGN